MSNVIAVSIAGATILRSADYSNEQGRGALFAGGLNRAARTLERVGLVTGRGENNCSGYWLTDAGRAWLKAYYAATNTEGRAHFDAVRVDYSDKGTDATNAALDAIDATRAALNAAIRKLFKVTKAQANSAAAEYADMGESLVRAVGNATTRY